MTTTFFAGLQWLIFMFANTVVIPISIGEALALPQAEVVAAIQRSFIFTGIACILQGYFGHRLALMEGQSGLWWGVILSLGASASTLGVSLPTLGGSLAVGIMISGFLVMFFGLLGMGELLKKWFTPVAMAVFLILLANQLIYIFLVGMLGLTDSDVINLPVTVFSFILAAIVIWLNVKGKGLIRNFSLLIGLVVGWAVFVLIFPSKSLHTGGETSSLIAYFPWGEPSFELGIVMTVVLTGLLNTSNTVATLKGAADVFEQEIPSKKYRASFFITGILNMISGVIGVVPYAPYTSSLGFLQSTGIRERAPFIVGSVMFIMLGFTPPLGKFFSLMPLSIGHTVLFVAYLQLFGSALRNIEGLTFTPKTIYRIAIPALLGMTIINLPTEAFSSMPTLIQPLVSNGLLMGILLALFIDNLIDWDKINHA
ncbi:MAG TPA: uracil/xanthine transporter [Bacilli bacterium]|nr:uracil/xanthine transporter [Bacilli bacterium]